MRIRKASFGNRRRASSILSSLRAKEYLTPKQMKMVDHEMRFGDVCRMALDAEHDFALHLFENVNSLRDMK